MRYYLDTEFLQGTQNKLFGKTKQMIELISIGLVDENGREFYAISKEFNLKEAWNRYDEVINKRFPQGAEYDRIYWIRNNVLRPIFVELANIHIEYVNKAHRMGIGVTKKDIFKFSYKNMKWLLNTYGEKNIEIANSICAFIYGDDCGGSGMSAIEMAMKYEISDKTLEPEFYAYYASYDWVVFCQIFGGMMSLPKGFPMHINCLKQMMDEIVAKKDWYYGRDIWSNTRKEGDMELQEKDRPATLEEKLEKFKRHDDYPKQTVEHVAIEDAKWDLKLHNFLKNCK